MSENLVNEFCLINDVDFRQYGLIPQTNEFYTNLTDNIKTMDVLDRSLLLSYILKNLFYNYNENKGFHPIALFNLIRILQDTANFSHTLKMKLSKIVISGSVCNKCNNVLPDMTAEMILQGLNQECPHNSVNVCFDGVEEFKA